MRQRTVRISVIVALFVAVVGIGAEELELDPLLELLVEQGVITGTSGRYGQILKLRPPLVFSRADADKVLAAIDSALHKLEI